jgi:6-phosphogluconolactonase/glucosamine-6-phosphate isomerase/deaminase
MRCCIVGLSHGISPSGAYEYIITHYKEIKRPECLFYTFVNSPLKRQRDLRGVIDAKLFLQKLYKLGYISRDQILGRSLNRDNMDTYAIEFNKLISTVLEANNKTGFDYVFLASNPSGRVAGIERRSKAFDSEEIAVVVNVKGEIELTGTPHFLLKSSRIAFLATKSDKRRALAWLYAIWGKPNESPSFLRFADNVKNRITVFVDDQALTWPQIEVVRKTPYGDSNIRIDLANPYKPNAKEKLPVIILLHGFLGLNSFDALLTAVPSHQYIAAAMHYGSIPNDLPPSEYSKHIVKNIESVVAYFGENDHPVYLFDHSMGNIYFMMIDRDFKQLPGIKKYLCGRIGANPFFGEETKHATVGFLDNVIIPSMSWQNPPAKALILGFRRIIPLDSKDGVRKRGIQLSDWLIRKESSIRDRIWSAAKSRILFLMTNMDSLPHLNRVPIEKALNRLPAKVFAIQTHSALEESRAFDDQQGLINMLKHNIPVLILKSERDGVAKYVHRIYESNGVEVIDVTNEEEKDLFKEHLYHMVDPLNTVAIIDKFVSESEAARKQRMEQIS